VEEFEVAARDKLLPHVRQQGEDIGIGKFS
jgi:hypothetical protein